MSERMVSRGHGEKEVVHMIIKEEEEDDEEREIDSEPDSWCTNEDYEEGIDPFEDGTSFSSDDEWTPPSSTRPTTSTPSRLSGASSTGQRKRGRSPSPEVSSPSSAPPSPAKWWRGASGRGRAQKSLPLQSPAKQGIRWNDVEEGDVLHRLPNFCPKRTPGLQTFIGEDRTPVRIFQKFFDDRDVAKICLHTNRNAAKRLARGKKFKWNKLTPGEFYQYVGLLFYMAILPLPRLRDYWRQRSIFSMSFPPTIMSRDRFLAIATNVHISHPDEDVVNDSKKGTPHYDPLHRLKPLYNSMRDACKALWQPRKEVAIDERMVATKAKIGLRQHMKAKPTKCGVKLFVLADSSNGYTVDFTVYTGKSKFKSGQGLSYDVVMSLMDKSYMGSGYHLYCDNFYTSPKLFKDLYAQGYVACGTYRDSRRGSPTTTENALTDKSARGSIKWIREQELLFIKWMDTRQVSLCSTIHTAFSGHTVTRNVKEKGKWEKKVISAPDAVIDYNKHMGRVDLSDQVLQYYSVRRQTLTWYRTLLYHFIDIAATNSYILYLEQRSERNKKPMTHLEFMEKLASGLCGVSNDWPLPYRGADCMPVCLGASVAGEAEPDNTTERGRGPGTAAKGRRRCTNCGKCATWKCSHCDVVLCLVAHRNCFANWHAKKAPVGPCPPTKMSDANSS